MSSPPVPAVHWETPAAAVLGIRNRACSNERPTPVGRAGSSLSDCKDQTARKFQPYTPDSENDDSLCASRAGVHVAGLNMPGGLHVDWATPAVRHGTQFPSSTVGQISSMSEMHSRWEPLIRTKDGLLQQRDLIIQRLERQLAVVKQQCADSQQHVQRLLRQQVQGDSTVLAIQLQERQNEVALLSAQLGEMSLTKDQEIASLQEKLGKAEYEACEAEKAATSARQAQQLSMEECQLKLASREEELEKLQQAAQNAGTAQNALQERLSTMEAYLAKVPTQDEIGKLTEAVATWRTKCSQLERTNEEQASSLKAVEEEVKKKDEDASQLQDQIAALLKIQSGQVRGSFQRAGQESKADLQARVVQLEVQSAGLQKVLSERESQATEDLQKLRQRYKQRYADATAALRSENKALAERIQSLKQLLLQEQTRVGQLEQELAERMASVASLQSSLVELSAVNQDLVQHSMEMEKVQNTRTASLEQLSASARRKFKGLHQEVTACITDLDSLLQVFKTCAHGQDPNMSQLLGLQSFHTAGPQPGQVPDHGEDEVDAFVDQLDVHLTTVQRLRTEIEHLRSTVADHYAQELGTGCPVQ